MPARSAGNLPTSQTRNVGRPYSQKCKKPPLRWLFEILSVALLFLYFQRSKLSGAIWQICADDRNGGPILGLLDCWEHPPCLR
jgi:hypothetical protein